MHIINTYLQTTSTLFIICTCINICVAGSQQEFMSEKPSFLQTCRTQDDNFNKCYIENMQAVLKHWTKGIPGLSSVGGFDPINLKKLRLTYNELAVELRDVVIEGLGNATITKAILRSKDFGFAIELQVPHLRLAADYQTNGRLLVLTLNGHGKMLLDMENVNLLLAFKVKLRDAHNYTFADVQGVRSKIKHIGKLHINMENLFNGERELEIQTNQLLNDNWREFGDILLPEIENVVDDLVTQRFKKIMNFIPSNYFIDDIPTAEMFNKNK